MCFISVRLDKYFQWCVKSTHAEFLVYYQLLCDYFNILHGAARRQHVIIIFLHIMLDVSHPQISLEFQQNQFAFIA